MLVLVCCLFGEVGIASRGTDISGQCINLSIPKGPEVTTLDDICQAAGYGHCLRISPTATISLYRNEDCTNLYASAVIDCDLPMAPLEDGKSAMTHGVICDMKTWGMVPQPDNVPGDFEQSIKNTTDWILGFVGMIAVLMLIWGGINYLTSAGDEDKARTGKKTITYALIGMVVAGIAYAIVDVIITVIL